MDETAKLTAAYEAARDAARIDRTPEAMEAARVASAALSAHLDATGQRPKGRGFASRAGRRQAAERRGR